MSGLTLKQANTIIEGAIAKAHEMKIKPLAVVVLDAAGNIVSAQREDNASMFRMDVALGKAWGAVAMGCSSRALGKRAKDNPNFFLSLACDRQRQVPAADGRCADQGRAGQHTRLGGRERRHGRRRRSVLRGGHRKSRPQGRCLGVRGRES